MADFEIRINTPFEGATYRQGATATLTGVILKDGEVFRPNLPGETTGSTARTR